MYAMYICGWGTNYTFLCNYWPSKVFITIWVPKQGQFGGQLQIQFHIKGCIFHLNLGSTLAPVQFMSNLSLLGGGQLQIQIHIWVVLFDLNFRCTLALVLFCLTWASFGRVNSRSVFGFDLRLGSTLVPFPFMSHLSLFWVVG